jgi:hypothetical protein
MNPEHPADQLSPETRERLEALAAEIPDPGPQPQRAPLNYLVPDPNNPGAMMARYPVSSVMDSAYEHSGEAKRGSPAASAHAYIDYLEGCLADGLERIGAVELRLRVLEAAHADLNVAFYRRVAEFESRLDNAQAEIKDWKTVALDLVERLHAIEHPIVAKNS